MKKLSIRNQNLISNSMRMIGFNNPEDNYLYIEEELNASQAKQIKKFLTWLYDINRPFGPANAQQRWNEFISGDKVPDNFYELAYSYILIYI